MMKSSIFAFAMAVAAVGQAVQPVVVIATEGIPATGSGGLNVIFVNNPAVTPGGKIGFAVGMGPAATTTAHGLFRDNQVIYNGTVNGYTGAEGSVGILETGEIMYSPATAGGDAVVSNLNGILLQETDPAPGFAGLFSRFNSRPSAAATSGEFFWIGGLTNVVGGSTQNRVFYRRSSAGAITPVMSTLTPILGLPWAGSGGAGLLFDYDVSANGSNLLNICNLSLAAGARQHLVLNGTSAVLRQGDAAPNATIPGQLLGTFAQPQINNAGQWAVRTTLILSPNPTLNVIQTNLDRLEAFSTVDQSTLPNNSVRAMGMNEDGFLAHIWGSSATSASLYIGRPGLMVASRLIVSAGDSIDLDGDFMTDAVLNSIDANSGTGQGVGLMENKDVILPATWTPTGGAEISGMIRIRMPILADINKDNEVGPADFATFAAAFGAFPDDTNWDADCDLNWDGEVGPADFAILAAEFGTFGP